MDNANNAGTSIVIDLDADSERLATVEVDEDAKLPAGAIVDGDVVDEDLDPSDRLPSHATKNADGTVTLPLMFPRTIRIKKNEKISERKFDELVLHRLNGADQRAIGAAKDDMMAVVALAQSAKLNLAVMNRLYDLMDASDITAAGQVLNNFLSSGPKTGRRA